MKKDLSTLAKIWIGTFYVGGVGILLKALSNKAHETGRRDRSLEINGSVIKLKAEIEKAKILREEEESKKGEEYNEN